MNSFELARPLNKIINLLFAAALVLVVLFTLFPNQVSEAVDILPKEDKRAQVIVGDQIKNKENAKNVALDIMKDYTEAMIEYQLAQKIGGENAASAIEAAKRVNALMEEYNFHMSEYEMFLDGGLPDGLSWSVTGV